MLKNTFCHVAGIGAKTEQYLWKQGILAWDDVVRQPAESWRQKNQPLFRKRIEESMARLDKHDARFFSGCLSSSQHWRLFREFRDSVAYLDIETTGSAGGDDVITTIAMYDGSSVSWFIQGDNLEKFKRAASDFKLLVTYNGRCFDIPFLRKSLHMRLDQAHIDLRFVLAKLGFRGGLKGCEKQLGIHREELDGLDGYAAVLLWNEFKMHRNWGALETLLAYNVLDAVNLERLMVTAYNLHVEKTPFAETHHMVLPQPVKNPFTPHQPTVEKIRRIMGFHQTGERFY